MLGFIKGLGKVTAFILYFVMSFLITIIGLGLQESALQDYRYSNVYVWQPADLPPDEKKVLTIRYADLIIFNKHLILDLYKEENIQYVITSKAPISPILIQNVPLKHTNITYSENYYRNYVVDNIKLLSTKDTEGKMIYYFLQGNVFNTDFDYAQKDKTITTGILPTDTKQTDKIYFYTLILVSILLAIIAVLFCVKALKNRNSWGKLIVSCTIMVAISLLIVGVGAIRTLLTIL